MKLPVKPGAVIRWKYRYDGVNQYQVAVLSLHADYEQGLVWHRDVWREPWPQDRMQSHVDSCDWGTWEIVHHGDGE